MHSYFSEKEIFVGATKGYDFFRIPTLIKAKDGSILAFCEGRKNGRSDTGDIDIVMRKSIDNGESFGEVKVVIKGDGNTFGNPSTVLDKDTGVIWMAFNYNRADGPEKSIHLGRAIRDVYVIKSEDNGDTWTGIKNITKDVKKEGWAWYATGPCHGIQTKKGRLIFPCNHGLVKKEDEDRKKYSHIIYSDNHGETWIMVESENLKGGNESTIVELEDGSLLLNMRINKNFCRGISKSTDAGLTWSKLEYEKNLPDPVCQGNILRLSYSDDDKKSRILFSNNASKVREERKNMTVRISYDEAKTWKYSKVVHEKGSAYSDMVVLNDNKILLLYENWEENNQYARISAAIFNLEWLTNGKDNR